MSRQRRLGALLAGRKLPLARNPLIQMEFQQHVRNLPGAEATSAAGSYWRIEEPLPEVTPYTALPGLDPENLLTPEIRVLEEAGFPGLEDCLFLDLETCGFAGTPLFLAGVVVTGSGAAGASPPGASGAANGNPGNPESPRLVQLFARHYGEERAVTAAARDLLETCRLVVSFNGKSYDLPFLAERAARHGLGSLPERPHLDLLHAARRRWKNILPDCRLQTLEARFRGAIRGADVGGSEVPGRYHDYVRRNDPAVIAPVIRHNRLDLIALLVILGRLSRSSPQLSAQG